VSDIFSVLVRPFTILGKPRRGAEAAALLLAVLAIDFLLSLLLLPSFVAELKAVFAQHPEMGSSAKVGSVAFAVVISTILNSLIIMVMTTLFLLALLTYGARTSPARLFSAILLASAPLILDRALRVAATYFVPGRTSADSVLPFGLLIPSSAGSDLHRVLAYFTFFDLWTLGLVLIGVQQASGLKPLPAFALGLILWGALQGVLLQLHLNGVIG
jgi:hypothetical protein